MMDISSSSLVDVARQHADKARHLINASKNTFGFPSRIASSFALPIGDYLSKKWLERTKNPYLDEINQYAEILHVPGIYALNMCYEWGCTSGVYMLDGVPTLLRVLDWPFPGLGENMVVARQRGMAGDFYNITWPGVSGIFQATAPGRFAIALNQAPMRRHKTGIFLDWIRNRIIANRQDALPPAHLLRRAFEVCKNYDEVVSLLSTEPVSIPVLYTIAGVQEGEGCVIERLETQSNIRPLSTRRSSFSSICVANHFEGSFNGIGHGWLPRALKSDERSLCAMQLQSHEIDEKFTWFRAPIANNLSRLAFKATPAIGDFSLVGTNGSKIVTEPICVGQVKA